VTKELTEFHRNKTRSNGRRYVCKECRRTRRERAGWDKHPFVREYKRLKKRLANNWEHSVEEVARARFVNARHTFCPSCTIYKFPTEFYPAFTEAAVERTFCRPYCKNCERLRRKYKDKPFCQGRVVDSNIPSREWFFYKPDHDRQRELVKQWKEYLAAQRGD
jgi:hypothetical protein